MNSVSGAPQNTETVDRTKIPRLGRFELIARLVSIQILVIFAGMTLFTFSSFPPGAFERDWTMWHRAGSLWWEGRILEIYSESFATGYPFIHPPYAIYLFAFFSLVPYHWVQLASMIGNMITLGATLWCLRSVLRGSPEKYLTISLVTFASAPWLTVMITGQLSMLYLFLIAAGLWTWNSDRPFLTGVLWAGLAMKPNIVLPLVFCCVVSRQWQVLRGMALCFVLFLASTIFMGIGVWQAMLSNMVKTTALIRECPDLIWKHQTLYAFWSSLISSQLSREWVDAIWAFTTMGLFVVTMRAWWRGVTRERLPRLVGITTLFIVAGNTYLWFYDSLFIVIPGVVWFLSRLTYTSPSRHLLIGILLTFSFFWQHLTLFWIKRGPSLTGGFLSLWLLIEAFDLEKEKTNPERFTSL